MDRPVDQANVLSTSPMRRRGDTSDFSLGFAVSKTWACRLNLADSIRQSNHELHCTRVGWDNLCFPHCAFGRQKLGEARWVGVSTEVYQDGQELQGPEGHLLTICPSIY